MATVPMTSEDEDFLVVEDLDLGDESELRRVVAEIESLVSAPGRGLRVSVLTTEQWRTVLSRLLKPALRRGAERYVHTLRDPRDPQHLLISPSMVQGINESDRRMYQELAYSVLRSLPTELGDSLRRGLDDIIAEQIATQIGVELYCRNYPREREFVRSILAILADQFGYEIDDWALEMRRRPRRIFMALRKSNFGEVWVERADGAIGERGGEALVELLADPKLELDEPLALITGEALSDYLTAQPTRRKERRR